MIRFCVDVVWIDLIQNYGICAQLYQFHNYSCAQHFFNAVAFRVFAFAFCCDMQWRSLVGEIWHPSVEEVKAPDVYWWDSVTAILSESNSSHFSTTLHTGNMWAYASDGSQWVHIDVIIFVPPEINTHFFTNIITLKGDFLITVSPSINRSAWLVSIN